MRVPGKVSDSPGTVGPNGLSQAIELVSKGKKANEENVSICKFPLHSVPYGASLQNPGCGFLGLITETLLRAGEPQLGGSGKPCGGRGGRVLTAAECDRRGERASPQALSWEEQTESKRGEEGADHPASVRKE